MSINDNRFPDHALTGKCPLCNVEIVRWDGRLFDYKTAKRVNGTRYFTSIEHRCEKVKQ